MQIINNPNFGGMIGGAFGQGVSQGINDILDMRLKEALEKRQTNQLTDAFKGLGFNDQQASALSIMSQRNPKVLQNILGSGFGMPSSGMSKLSQDDLTSKYLSGELLNQPESKQAVQEVTKAVKSKQPMEKQEQSAAAKMIQQTPAKVAPEEIAKSIGKSPMDLYQNPVDLGLKQVTKEGLLPVIKSSKRRQRERGLNPELVQRIATGEKPDEIKKEYADLLEQEEVRSEVDRNAEESKDRSSAISKTRANIDPKIVMKAFDMTEGARKEISDANSAARNSDMRLDRISQLDKEGKIQGRFERWARTKLGFGGTEFSNDATQELEKLSTDFIRDAKKIFGSRITNADLEYFQKMIPTLAQSKEGRKRVIRNLKIFNEAAKLRYKEMRNIMKQNNGIPPLDIENIIEDRLGDKLDRLHEKFVFGDREGKYKVGHQFTEKPKAEDFPYGGFITNKKGEKEYAGGTEWIPEQEWLKTV